MGIAKKKLTIQVGNKPQGFFLEVATLLRAKTLGVSLRDGKNPQMKRARRLRLALVKGGEEERLRYVQ
jgi:hypothetical protein